MEKLDYKTAVEKLQSIVSEIENTEMSFDEMIKKIEQAMNLIKTCENELVDFEGRLNKITATKN